jgi:uncharacterized protein (PEP-CTERM system associated)
MAVTANKLRPHSVNTAPHRSVPLAGALSVFITMAFASTAHALDWNFEPSVGAAATYTDNVNQSATSPEDALILNVTPGFSLISKGSSRVQATVQYGLRSVARFGDNESTDLNHNLNAIGTAELVEDFLFIDGSARVSQELISLFGSPAEADVNDANRATVGTYSISPYIQKRLGTFANAQARYTASGAIFENNVAANSASNAFSAGLTSGTRFDDLSWGLNYSIRDTQNRDAADSTFESASATVGYALTRKFRVFGTVGQDWNDYLSTTETGGSSYSIGFGWSPTRRTSVEASAGERYFGRTYSFTGSHRTRLSRWTLRYSEDVSDISRLDVDFNDLQKAVVKSCPPGTVLTLPITLDQVIDAECDVDLFFGSSITNGVFIAKLLTADVSWDVGSRTSVSMTLSDLTREFQLGSQGEDRVQAATGAVSYRMTPRTNATTSLSLIRNRGDAAATGSTARDDGIWRLSFGLNHQFAEDLGGALTIQHIQRDSNVATADYEENRLTATVNMRF